MYYSVYSLLLHFTTLCIFYLSCLTRYIYCCIYTGFSMRETAFWRLLIHDSDVILFTVVNAAMLDVQREYYVAAA